MESGIYGFVWTEAGELLHAMPLLELAPLYGLSPAHLLRELLRVRNELGRDPAPLHVELVEGRFLITLTPKNPL